jgi:hypothetical protein
LGPKQVGERQLPVQANEVRCAVPRQRDRGKVHRPSDGDPPSFWVWEEGLRELVLFFGVFFYKSVSNYVKPK